MSYDMNIGDEEFNYTYNVAPMWYRAAPEDGIRSHYGLTGRAAIPVLQKLRNYLEDHQVDLLKLEPANGWGSWSGALEFTNGLIAASFRNPADIWKGD